MLGCHSELSRARKVAAVSVDVDRDVIAAR
jgi:hypothetical protein